MINRNKKVLIALGSVLLVNFVLFSFVYLLFREAQAKRHQAALNKRQLLAIEKRIENAKNIEKVLEQRQTEQGRISSLYLSKESIIDFIEELEFLAQKSDAVLETKSIAFPQNNKGFPRFSLSLTGSFPAIYKYLLLLEKDRYQVILEKVYIKKSRLGEDWESNMEIRFLNFNDESQAD